MKQIRALGGAMLLLLCAGIFGQAQQPMATNTNVAVPPLVNFSGTLTDAHGKPVSGSVALTFSLYSEQTGGAALWMESQTVQSDDNGHYTVMLGSTSSTGLPAEIFVVGQAHWLGVQVQEQQEQPRVLLVSAPYAIKALDADTLGGKPASAFVAASVSNASSPTSNSATARGKAQTANKNVADVTGTGTANFIPLWTTPTQLGSSAIFQSTSQNIGIGTTAPTGPLTVESNSTSGNVIYGFATGTSGTTVGVQGTSASSGGFGVIGDATSATGNTVGVEGSNESSAGRGVWGLATSTSGTTYGVVGTNGSSAGTGVFGNATSTSGVTVGVEGKSASSGGLAILGDATSTTGNTVGVEGSIESSGGRGVWGLASSTSGTTYGVVGTNASSEGTGVFGNATSTSGTTVGVQGKSAGSDGFGVLGSATSTSGDTVGVEGTADSSEGTGVYGSATSTTGATYGVEAAVASSEGTGVSGFASSTTGTTVGVLGKSASSEGLGVVGDATSTSGDTVGVEGTAASSEGTGLYGSATSTSGDTFGVEGTAASSAGVGVSGFASSTSGTTVGVEGKSVSSDGFGVLGSAISTSGDTVGVEGTAASSEGTGVYGSATSPSGTTYGVEAAATSSAGTGVSGFASSKSGTTYGVQGKSASSGGAGVYGVAAAPSAEGTIVTNRPLGAWGDTNAVPSGAVAVLGTADDGIGVVALNNSPSGYVTLGAQSSESADGSFLLFHVANTSFGGICEIDVSGNLTCNGSISDAVPMADGRRVALYAVEAADNWFEDAGSGKLVNGMATVSLNPTLAETVNAAIEYHVFLTPQGECEGLYVGKKTPEGFEVHELHGGHSAVSFDYRIMARRKGYEQIRLADVTEQMRQPVLGSARPARMAESHGANDVKF